MTRMRVIIVCVALITGVASADAYDETAIDVGRGPVSVFVPDSYDDRRPVPLLMALHGLGMSGATLEFFMRFKPQLDEYEFIYALPNGTEDDLGRPFWNATPACCDLFGSGVDDSGYLRRLIDELKARYSIDPSRVFLVGHSNGGFMAYRMACDHAGVVTGVVSHAGAMFLDPAACQPIAPVHVLQISGTADPGLLYEGGCFQQSSCYPGAFDTVNQWVEHNGCSPTADTLLPPLDLSDLIPGTETTIHRYRTDCTFGGSAELWTVVGGAHAPLYNSSFAREVLDLFYSHPQPRPAPRGPAVRVGPR